MKLKSINLFSMLALGLTLSIISCSSDDNATDPGTSGAAPTCSDNIQNGDETGVDCGGSCTACSDDNSSTTNLEGNITEDRTLNASETYTLKGTLNINSGATLTIPAGTTIVSETGTENYIAVQQGGKIDIQGTATAPVVMTSEDETPGDWGGLVIAGKATTTEGINATAEVGGIIYGGTDNADDSGSINYLIINYAGAQINSESQYNGLTLYAVGSETSIENVAILNGTDDGVEFFGGTVSASNFYLENNEDDAIDWTEGWNGTLTNAYISHTRAGFSTAVEADGVNNNPSLVNLTAVSTQEGTALQFKAESGATITNLYLSGYETLVDMKDDGPLANIQIDGATATVEGPYDEGTQVDVTMFDWARN